MYHKTTDLTIKLLQNYRFKVKYHKTIDLTIKLSNTTNFNVEILSTNVIFEL
jgi:hypothetical protein